MGRSPRGGVQPIGKSRKGESKKGRKKGKEREMGGVNAI